MKVVESGGWPISQPRLSIGITEEELAGLVEGRAIVYPSEQLEITITVLPTKEPTSGGSIAKVRKVL